MKPLTLFLCTHFLLISLLPSGKVFELWKFEALQAHFVHHLQDHRENISFSYFLYLHYFDTLHQQQDAQEHQGLPLTPQKAEKNNHSFASVLTSVPCFDFSFTHSERLSSLTVFYSSIYVLSLAAAIWQPPRLDS